MVGALPQTADSGIDLDLNNINGDGMFNCRYDLDYKIVNGAAFELPHTGSSGFRWIWLSMACAVLLAGGGMVWYAVSKRKRPTD